MRDLNKWNVLSVNITPLELKALKRLAGCEGVSVSQYVRDKLDPFIAKALEDIKKESLSKSS